jgi:hypothetical protein
LYQQIQPESGQPLRLPTRQTLALLVATVLNLAHKMKFNIYLLTLLLFLTSKALAIDISPQLELISPHPEHIQHIKNKYIVHEYQANHPPILYFKNNSNAIICMINKMDCTKNSRFILPINGNQPTLYRITFGNNQKIEEFSIQIFPDNFPKFKIEGQSALNKSIIFSQFSFNKNTTITTPSHLFILDPKGNILFYNSLPFLAFDFKPHLLKNKKYYSYLQAEQLSPKVTALGKRVILDENFNTVKTIPGPLDIHDFILIDLEWYICLRYELAQNTTGTFFINQRIEEYKNGKQIFQWDLNDLAKNNYFAINTTQHMFDKKLAIDQFHLNSIQLLPNNKMLISLGYDSGLVIDRKTKKIDWVIGGYNDQFGITEEMGTALHHTPFLDIEKQTLTAFDNSIIKKKSRVIEFTLDLKNKKIKKFDVIHDEGQFSAVMGSVEKHNNIYSIGFGSRDIGKFDFIEQTKDKRTMGISFSQKYSSTYRFYREL